MLDVSMQVDRASVDAVADAIKRAQKDFGKSVEQSVIWTSHVVAQAGKNLAKPGKKTRTLQSRQVQGGKRIWFVEVYSQKRLRPKEVVVGIGKRPSVKGNAKLQRMRQIKRAGLARRVWSAIDGKIGGVRGGVVQGLSGVRKFGRTVNANARVKKSMREHDSRVDLTNRLTYLESAYPGMTSTMLSKGARTLQTRMDKAAEHVGRRFL